MTESGKNAIKTPKADDQIQNGNPLPGARSARKLLHELTYLIR